MIWDISEPGRLWNLWNHHARKCIGPWTLIHTAAGRLSSGIRLIWSAVCTTPKNYCAGKKGVWITNRNLFIFRLTASHSAETSASAWWIALVVFVKQIRFSAQKALIPKHKSSFNPTNEVTRRRYFRKVPFGVVHITFNTFSIHMHFHEKSSSLWEQRDANL